MSLTGMETEKVGIVFLLDGFRHILWVQICSSSFQVI